MGANIASSLCKPSDPTREHHFGNFTGPIASNGQELPSVPFKDPTPVAVHAIMLVSFTEWAKAAMGVIGFPSSSLKETAWMCSIEV